jgi:signal transduction histidine kinase
MVAEKTPGNSVEKLVPALSFEQIIHATLGLVRTHWKVSICFFMQLDDKGQLRVRGADGLPDVDWGNFKISPTVGLAGRSVATNDIIETTMLPSTDAMAPLLNPSLKTDTHRFVLVPVAGEVRTLGILVVGPFMPEQDLSQRLPELRSAGALCAVLSAHWRLYDWIRHYIPEANHELRTPLTAVQGSLGMVLGGMFGQLGTEVREMLEMAQKGCERTVRAIEDYLNTPRPPTDGQ